MSRHALSDGLRSAHRHTVDLNFGPLLEPLAAIRPVIALEFEGHGHTADTGRPMTIETLAGAVVALLDHLGITQADLFGFSLGGSVAFNAPAQVCKLIAASADAYRPPGRESATGRGPHADTSRLQAMRDA